MENVLDEQQHVVTYIVTEILHHGQRGKRDKKTTTWWLFHLTKHQSRLAALIAYNAGIDHLMPQIITLTSTLTNTGEHGITTVTLRDVVDQLHDDNGFAYTRATEQTDFTTFGVWAKKV